MSAYNAGFMIVYSGATVSGMYGGGYTAVNSGGHLYNSYISGGIIYVYSGGVAVSTTLAYNSTEIVSAGGVASATTVGLDSYEQILSGGTTSELLISSGGMAFVSSGGYAYDTTVLAGGVMSMIGNARANWINVQGGIVLSGGATISGTLTLGGGASATIYNTLSGPGTISMYTGGTANHLYVGYGASITQAISGFVATDLIEFMGLTYTGASLTYSQTTTSTGTLKVLEGGVVANTLTLAGTFVSTSFHLGSSTTGVDVTYS